MANIIFLLADDAEMLIYIDYIFFVVDIIIFLFLIGFVIFYIVTVIIYTCF